MMAEVDALSNTAAKLVSELSVNRLDADLDDAYDWMLKVAELRRAIKAVRGAFYANNIRGLIDTVNNMNDATVMMNVDGEKIYNLLNTSFDKKSDR